MMMRSAPGRPSTSPGTSHARGAARDVTARPAIANRSDATGLIVSPLAGTLTAGVSASLLDESRVGAGVGVGDGVDDGEIAAGTTGDGETLGSADLDEGSGDSAGTGSDGVGDPGDGVAVGSGSGDWDGSGDSDGNGEAVGSGSDTVGSGSGATVGRGTGDGEGAMVTSGSNAVTVGSGSGASVGNASVGSAAAACPAVTPSTLATMSAPAR